MGQNLAIIWSTEPLDANDGDFPSRIKSWFNEVQKYSFGDAWSPKTGHYSQLVWGETSLVGCGFSEYKDSQKYNKLYVCNYGPGGNIVGFAPYEVGRPSCNTYGMKPSPRYSGLCAAPGSTNSDINANAIETYEYMLTNPIYNKQTTFSPQLFLQSYSPQAASVFNAETNSKSSHILSTNRPIVSFGSKSLDVRASHSTNFTQQNKYKNKLETYKPSQEFQKSVFKHTILRTYLNQSKTSNFEKNENINRKTETQISSTQRPAAKSGWSLSTWRG